MNNKPVKTLALLCLIVTLFTDCKKNKDDDTEVPVTETTIAGTYTLSSLTETSSLLGERDLLSEMNECKRDDEYVLNPDKSYMYKDLGAVCTLDGTHPGVWILLGENITFDLYTGKIEKLTNQQLVVTQNFSLLGVAYTKKAVFTRK